MKINNIVIGILIVMLGQSNAIAKTKSIDNEVRVHNWFDLPLDPSTLSTMSEYNLSLCIFRTLFEMDVASIPTSKILSSWKYREDTKSYLLTIGDIKWSDGKIFTSNDIKESLLRLKTVAPEHFKSLETLMSDKLDKSLKIINEKQLSVAVKKSGVELFKRLSGAFIPLIRKDQLDSKTKLVKHNNISLGPYKIDKKQSDSTNLHLILNMNYFGLNNSMPKKVHMKPFPAEINRVKVIMIGQKNVWPNLILGQVFISPKQQKVLNANRISIWTRPIDRILLLIPTKKATADKQLYSVLQWLGSKLEKNPIKWNSYLGVSTADSLQPPGFILNKKVTYIAKEKPIDRVYKIAVSDTQLPAQYIIDHFRKLGLKAEFEFVKNKKIKSLDDEMYDFRLYDFGAADPSPVTWLNLVLEHKRKFIGDYNNITRNKYREALKIGTDSQRDSKLREVLHDAGSIGQYLPLAHFSSIAVGGNNINLDGIWDSDETVDISKIQIKPIKID